MGMFWKGGGDCFISCKRLHIDYYCVQYQLMSESNHRRHQIYHHRFNQNNNTHLDNFSAIKCLWKEVGLSLQSEMNIETATGWAGPEGRSTQPYIVTNQFMVFKDVYCSPFEFQSEQKTGKIRQ